MDTNFARVSTDGLMIRGGSSLQDVSSSFRVSLQRRTRNDIYFPNNVIKRIFRLEFNSHRLPCVLIKVDPRPEACGLQD
jgi:hypothetical protein